MSYLDKLLAAGSLCLQRSLRMMPVTIHRWLLLRGAQKNGSMENRSGAWGALAASKKKIDRPLFALCVLVASVTGSAYAAPITGTMTGNYFTVLSDPDFNQHQLTSLTVQAQLGPNGLPVFSSGSVPVNDLTTDNEITWWSPSLNSNVIVSSVPSGVVNLPLNTSMYAPAPGVGTGPSPNNLGFLTAHFTATILSASPTLYAFLGADDDAFLYIDGQLISQIGGVHAFEYAPVASFASAGSHTLDLFYADREQTEARLFFALSDTPTLVIPEPATFALLAASLIGFAFSRRGILKRKDSSRCAKSLVFQGHSLDARGWRHLNS